MATATGAAGSGSGAGGNNTLHIAALTGSADAVRAALAAEGKAGAAEENAFGKLPEELCGDAGARAVLVAARKEQTRANAAALASTTEALRALTEEAAELRKAQAKAQYRIRLLVRELTAAESAAPAGSGAGAGADVDAWGVVPPGHTVYSWTGVHRPRR